MGLNHCTTHCRGGPMCPSVFRPACPSVFRPACPSVFGSGRTHRSVRPYIRPYVDNDTMDVIGHTNEFVAWDVWIFVSQFRIPSFNHPSRVIQPHFVIGDDPEQACPVLCAEDHKIGPGLGIIVSWQTKGSALVNIRVVFHVIILAFFKNSMKRSSAS
jgi:hypothetical protein